MDSITNNTFQFITMKLLNQNQFQIMLKEIHLSMDYGLILTWSVSINDFSCDAVVVYKVSNGIETLLNNLPVKLFFTSKAIANFSLKYRSRYYYFVSDSLRKL